MEFHKRNSDNSAKHINRSLEHFTSSSSSPLSTTASEAPTSSATRVRHKRKNRSSVTFDSQDPEVSFEPPSAKRAHRRPSYCNSDSVSIASSVYPSPVDELINEIYVTSSSDILSGGLEFEVDDISVSPHSIENDSSPSNSSEVSEASESSADHCPGANEKRLGIHQEQSFDDYVSHYCMTPIDNEIRMCPLPALSWANASDVWNLMCKKDEQASCFRDAGMLDNHPGLHPRMRAILLDWLIEVCEVYKLHRETYYLAVDYLDRYLSTQKKVQKTHLQLIGITCLFIAAKVEEIYPPKIGEFAYVTDGACREEDILQHEILLLQTLDWSINPITVMGWLGVYMQLNVSNRTPASLNVSAPIIHHNPNNSIALSTAAAASSKSNHPNLVAHKISFSCSTQKRKSDLIDNVSDNVLSVPAVKYVNDEAFIYPQFSGMEFVQTAQLLDLCSLDVGMGNFPYSVLAAAAISHTFNKETALRVSSLDWRTINSCAKWMEPFFQVISEEAQHLRFLEQNEQMPSKHGLGHICPNIVTDESHIIQTHSTSMGMYDRAFLYREQYILISTKEEASPAIGLICPEGLLTPPASSRKTLDDEDDEQNINSHIQIKNNL